MEAIATGYIKALTEAGFSEKQAKAIAIANEAKLAQSSFITRAEFDSRLERLENTLIKWTVGTALAVFIAIFTVTEFRLSSINQRFEAIDQRFEAIDQRFEAIDLKFEAIDQRFEAVTTRLETIEKVVSQNQASIQKLIEIHLDQARK